MISEKQTENIELDRHVIIHFRWILFLNDSHSNAKTFPSVFNKMKFNSYKTVQYQLLWQLTASFSCTYFQCEAKKSTLWIQWLHISLFIVDLCLDKLKWNIKISRELLFVSCLRILKLIYSSTRPANIIAWIINNTNGLKYLIKSSRNKPSFHCNIEI